MFEPLLLLLMLMLNEGFGKSFVDSEFAPFYN